MRVILSFHDDGILSYEIRAYFSITRYDENSRFETYSCIP